jgi:hypothetical protein
MVVLFVPLIGSQDNLENVFILFSQTSRLLKIFCQLLKKSLKDHLLSIYVLFSAFYSHKVKISKIPKPAQNA